MDKIQDKGHIRTMPMDESENKVQLLFGSVQQYSPGALIRTEVLVEATQAAIQSQSPQIGALIRTQGDWKPKFSKSTN